MRKKIELPIEELIKKYEEGSKISTLAKEYNVTRHTVLQRINEYYMESGKPKPRRLESATVIIEYLNKGLSIEEILEIAKENHIIISQNVISTALNRQETKKHLTNYRKISRRDYNESSKKDCIRKELPIEEIIKKYEEGAKISTLAEEYNMAENTMSRKINGYYNERGKQKPKRLQSSAVIIEYLNKGLSIEEILEIAKKHQIIIPQNVLNTALHAKTNDKNSTDYNIKR